MNKYADDDGLSSVVVPRRGQWNDEWEVKKPLFFPKPRLDKEEAAEPAQRVDERDLTEEQSIAFDMINDWQMAGGGAENILKLGGYAGCLSGDTLVRYSRGDRVGSRLIPLRDLYLKFNGHSGSGRGAAQKWPNRNAPTFLKSLWPNGVVSRNRVVAVFESGIKQVIRLVFSSGKCLVLTEDHPIATPDGDFVAAGDLLVGDSVLACGTMKATKGEGLRLDRRPHRVVVNTRYHPFGATKTVVCNGVSYAYTRVPRARLVVEAAVNRISYSEFVHCLKTNAEASATFVFMPKDVDVHHRNEDTMDDSIGNLEVLPHKEHARRHGKEENFHKDYLQEVKVMSTTPAGEEMTYDVQMSSPANNFSANGIFVHNTGKSTLLSLFAERSRQSAFCCYTAKATDVLRRKMRALGMPPDFLENNVRTIHSLIYRPVEDGKGGVAEWQRRSVKQVQDEFSRIVIDEASMVHEEMLEDLKEFDLPILAVGDHGQLPPIGGTGSLMAEPDVRLEKIHRQAEGSPIIALAHRIRVDGKLPNHKDLPAGGAIQFVELGKLSSILQELYEQYPPSEVALLSYMNATRQQLNRLARRVWLERIEDSDKRDGRLSNGEQLICLKNRHPHLFNGMRGTVVDKPRAPAQVNEQNWWDACVDFPDHDIRMEGHLLAGQLGRNYTFGDLLEVQRSLDLGVSKWREVGLLMDYGYALTVHKSQGSGFKAVVLRYERPGKVSDEDFRRWLYTAATRAADKLYIAV